jgi:hypothetical protein
MAAAAALWTRLSRALIALGLYTGLVEYAESGQVPQEQADQWRRILRPACMAAAAAIVAGIIAGFAIDPNTYDVLGGLLGGGGFSFASFLIIGFTAGIVIGIAGVDVEQAPTAAPLRLRKRSRTRPARPPFGRVGRGGIVILGIVLAWALGSGVTQAVRIAATPAFPAGGSAVVRLGDGGTYTDYPDGLRYVIPLNSGRYIVTTRKIKFYYTAYGAFYGSEADCLADNYGYGCSVHSAEMLRFTSGGNYGIVSATTLDGRDDLSPYMVNVVTNSGLNAKISSWLRAPSLSEVLGDVVAIGVAATFILLWACIVSGLLLWLALPSDITQAISPVPIMRTDRNAALWRGLALSLLVLAGFMAVDLATGRIYAVWHVLHLTNTIYPRRGSNAPILRIRIGVINGIPVWRIALGMIWPMAEVGLIWSISLGLLTITLSPWLRFQVARAWLAARGRVPPRLLGFLEEAHARGVLRQAGAAYQFRHVRLQERLASTQAVMASSQD